MEFSWTALVALVAALCGIIAATVKVWTDDDAHFAR
jgi:hypothetical protein